VKMKKIIALLTVVSLTASMLMGCAKSAENKGGSTDATETETEATGEIKEFTAFFAVPGSEINDDNEIQQMIAEKTGVKVKETWLAGQTADEAVGTIIAGGEYPDFINGGDGMQALYDAGALVAWDEYIEKYPNIKEFYSDADWEEFRQEDGHIYWMNPFDQVYGESKTTTHSGEAFWIQVRVLEWAKYPKIESLDEYFDLLRDYAAANPTMADGTENIPYTILCDDWRYFCLENPPLFLAGNPNDGSVIVNPETLKVEDYNTTDVAKRYFEKLNIEYKAGLVDPTSFTQTYDEYIAKLSTGRVLGMVDQWWNFAYTVNDVFKQQGLDNQGCNYVPLGITIDKGMENQWYTPGAQLNPSSGIAVTTSCEDPDAAFKFINDVLSQEIHDLRFWGVEGVDYAVDEDGMYYRTEDMRMTVADTSYKASHLSTYSYFPLWYGTSRDGKNAMQPAEQPVEFLDSLNDNVVKCFEAYGVTTYPDMIGSVDKAGVWYPMWSYSNTLTTDTPGGVAWTKMGEIKHEWLPQVVMADDFDKKWSEYMDVYSTAKPEDFLAEMQTELDRRISK